MYRLSIPTLLSLLLLTIPGLARGDDSVRVSLAASPAAPEMPVELLLENLRPENVEIDRLALIVEEDGQARSVYLLQLGLSMEPGQTRRVSHVIPGWDPGAETVRFETFGPEDRPRPIDSPRRTQVRDLQALLAESVRNPPTTREESLELLLENRDRLLREQEAATQAAHSPARPDIQVEYGEAEHFSGGLQQCMVFCHECAVLGALLCSYGVQEMQCECDRGVCSIICRP